MNSIKKWLFPTKAKVLSLIFVLLFISVLFVLEKTQIINLYSKDIPNTTETEKTTSTTETAQSDFTGADERQAGNTLNENKGSGGITDSKGSTSGQVDTSNPIISATKEISLYSPKSNLLITNGFEVSGLSTLNKVSYRIIDSVSGVISMGELGVSEGKFSGEIVFETSAADGRIDFYGTKTDGTEYSNVEVPVRFK